MNRILFIALISVALLPSFASGAQVKLVAKFTDPVNGFDDQFGNSVAIDGNTAVVGAPQHAGPTGFAEIFLNSGRDWKQAAKLTSGSSQTILFGTSVAVAGDTVVVATPSEQNESAMGVVFVFVKPQGGWAGNLTPTAELTVPSVVNNALGTSVAISSDGKTVVAGGPAPGGTSSGVYVFLEPPTGWADMTQPTATLTSSSGLEVGQSVAISDDGTTIVTGEAPTGNLNSALVFVESSGGWVSTTQPTATLTASDEARVDDFGYSVAIAGNTIVVGSPVHGGGKNPPGAAYVYVEPGTGWADMTQTAELTNPDLTKSPALGESVTVEENVVLAGAPIEAQGEVFAYVKPATGWANSSTPNGSAAGPGVQAQRFGWSVAMSGRTFVVGAPYYGGALQGAIYIFTKQ